MSKEKNTLTFVQQVEALFGQNERLIFSQDTPTTKVVISNMGVYCFKKNWLRNRSTIQFYPRRAIESVHYSVQGWLLSCVCIELIVTGRVVSVEGSATPIPIKIRLKNDQKEQSEALFSYCKTLLAN